jgi:CheY-like chemotaxis protein
MESKKILCIEDDAFLLSLISGKLVETGFAVVTAASGDAGITKAKLEHPDVILLDIMLPDMGGFEILEKLKGDPGTKDIPVIILSNLGGREEIAKAVQAGAASYVIKSNIVPDEIAEMVRTEIAKASGAPR